jgi:hypothetical protein
MSNGRRPDVHIRIRQKGDKDAPGIYIMAGWKKEPGDRKIELRLDDGWKIVGPDGDEYTTWVPNGPKGNAYLDLFVNDDQGRGGPGKPKSKPRQRQEGADNSDAGGGFGDDTGIPF